MRGSGEVSFSTFADLDFEDSIYGKMGNNNDFKYNSKGQALDRTALLVFAEVFSVGEKSVFVGLLNLN